MNVLKKINSFNLNARSLESYGFKMFTALVNIYSDSSLANQEQKSIFETFLDLLKCIFGNSRNSLATSRLVLTTSL